MESISGKARGFLLHFCHTSLPTISACRRSPLSHFPSYHFCMQAATGVVGSGFLLDHLDQWESFVGQAGVKAPRIFKAPYTMQVRLIPQSVQVCHIPQSVHQSPTVTVRCHIQLKRFGYVLLYTVCLVVHCVSCCTL